LHVKFVIIIHSLRPGSFHEQLERALDQFPSYHMKTLLGDFSAEVGREDTCIFKPTIWKESLNEFSDNDGVGVVNFATSKTLSLLRV